MKKIFYLSVLISLTFIASCDKKAGYSVTNYINGFVYITDTITSDWLKKPIHGVDIFLKRKTDSNDIYFLKTITDNDGYFYFEIPDTNDNYTVYLKDSIHDLAFTKSVTVEKDENQFLHQTIKWELTPDTPNRGVVFTIVDSVSQLPIPNVSVQIFTSKFLANLKDSNAASFKLVTNAKGRTSIMNLPAKEYYYNAITKLDTTLYSSLSNRIIVPPNGPILYEVKELEP